MNVLVAWHRRVTITADRRLTSRYRQFGYDWETDFPVGKQDESTASSKTKITLEFELNANETAEFNDEIGSNLNGHLPLQISFGRDSYKQEPFDITVKKQGKGHAALTHKKERIADFISKRISFGYIPAIRTAESASNVIRRLLDRELLRLEDDLEYQQAVAKIEELQKPILSELAKTIQSTVSAFVPNVTEVELQTLREYRYRSLRQDVEIVMNDGNQTKLERKGDGVQSLVALALMRHAAVQTSKDQSTIIAIEEPESHLHPEAVHELRSVIEKLSENNQVVLTSHSPLFVDPSRLERTIIVRNSKATAAKRISEVREVLGVRFSDNLESARMVLLVEGKGDAEVLRAILTDRSETIAKAFKKGIISIDYLNGVSNL